MEKAAQMCKELLASQLTNLIVQQEFQALLTQNRVSRPGSQRRTE
jgi:hypothetical protein